MHTINNINLLAGLISGKDLNLMEEEASGYRKEKGIRFKVLEVNTNSVVIRTWQDKNDLDKYENVKALVTLTRKLFSDKVKAHKIFVNPLPFKVPDCEIVNSHWIKGKMLEFGIKTNKVADEMGVERSVISDFIHDRVPLTRTIQALFWFYFLSKKFSNDL